MGLGSASFAYHSGIGCIPGVDHPKSDTHLGFPAISPSALKTKLCLLS
jgi:hypothetical protein